MISADSKITNADLAALATLANTKLAPGTPYAFTAFAGSDKIALPSDISPVATYGAPAGHFPAGGKVTLRLYAYKTIAGTKYFTAQPILKAFQPEFTTAVFKMDWSWDGGASVPASRRPDGYIVVIPRPNGGGTFEHAWQDIGNATTFSEDGSFSSPLWKFDQTLDAGNLGSPQGNLPCGRATALKTLNTIRNDALGKLDIFGGATVTADAQKVSGPWIVAAGEAVEPTALNPIGSPKCSLYLGGATRRTAFKNLKFIYSESDSLTGNQLAPEAEYNDYLGIKNNANNFNWDADVKITGRVVFFSDPFGQLPANWTLTASHPGITITFDPNYFAAGLALHTTAFIFDFVDVQYIVGTPIVLTATPKPGTGGSVNSPGNPAAAGAHMNCVFTGSKLDLPSSNTPIIHLSGVAGKSVALLSTLNAITLSTSLSVALPLESHWRAFCRGVFVANTLPTPGVMTYLDVDLPQYNPQELGDPSSRRVARADGLPYMPVTENHGALWPVFRDTDFIPDDVTGRPLNGSKAWQVLGTKFAEPNTLTDDVPPFEPNEVLWNSDFLFVPADATDVRFIAQNPDVILYAKFGGFPTLSDFDAQAPGGTWLSLAATLPGFAKDGYWYYSIYNPTDGSLTVTTTTLVIEEAAPNGTFFPTHKDDAGADVPATEGLSYKFSDPATIDHRPIPTVGYCIFSITLRRGVASVLASPLEVKIGLMPGFGFDTAGSFQELATFNLPPSQLSATFEVMWPVLQGSPLAYQCDEEVVVLAGVNFQPMMHSTFSQSPVKAFGGQDYVIGHYNGPLWMEQARALLYFKGGDKTAPLVLPISAPVYNDVEALLNTF